MSRRSGRGSDADRPDDRPVGEPDANSDDRPVGGADTDGRPRRAPVHTRPVDGLPRIDQLVRGATVLTALFTVAAVASAARPEWFVAAGVGMSVVLFVAGCASFVVGYARAVPRSRVDEIDLPGLFFLVGSVDRPVARRLVSLLVVQVVVGVAAASVRPFTPVAFCTLAPVFGLGVLALCGATHGRFPARRR
jgi:hypothetical protein